MYIYICTYTYIYICVCTLTHTCDPICACLSFARLRLRNPLRSPPFTVDRLSDLSSKAAASIVANFGTRGDANVWHFRRMSGNACIFGGPLSPLVVSISDCAKRIVKCESDQGLVRMRCLQRMSSFPKIRRCWNFSRIFFHEAKSSRLRRIPRAKWRRSRGFLCLSGIATG